MLNNNQIKLIQTAVRAAGLRSKNFDGRYRMLLAQYKQPNGSAVKSCKQLNNSQLDDLLAICEAHGWQMPDKPQDFYRTKVSKQYDTASFAQQSAIKHLAGDLGWNVHQLGGLLKRITEKEGWFVTDVASLSPGFAYKTIEALKAILGRERGKHYSNLKQIEQDCKEVTDGQTNQVG